MSEHCDHCADTELRAREWEDEAGRLSKRAQALLEQLLAVKRELGNTLWDIERELGKGVE